MSILVDFHILSYWVLLVRVSYYVQHSTSHTVGQSHLLHIHDVAGDVILVFRCLDPCFTHNMVIPTLPLEGSAVYLSLKHQIVVVTIP